ncbi:MAG: ThuA domain-containing protein, partial [Phycisphaerae bacterium]
KVRVLVWDEQQPTQKQAYGEKFLGQTIADHLAKNPALEVTSVGMPPRGEVDKDPALTAEALEKVDVLIWWGHARHREVPWETADRIVDRVKRNKLALIAIHSAHWASPFVRAMNAKTIERALASLPEADRAAAKVNLVYPKYVAVKQTTPLTPTWTATKGPDGATTLDVNLPICVFPEWRHDGKPGRMTTLAKDHPIAAGLPERWDVSKTEMYNEPFHVPAPDLLIFEERWDAGERFRSGMLWTVGEGRVFYFRPGHETYPVFKEALPLKVVENAAVWLGGQVR